MQPNLRCGDGDAELLGDRVVGELVDVSQHHDGAQLGWELIECDQQAVAQLARVCGERRVAVVVLVGDGAVGAELVVTVSSAPARLGHRSVRSDAVHPGGELGVASERVEAAVGPEVGLLRDVAGVFGAAGQPQRQGVGVAVRGFDQPGERGVVTVPGGCDVVGERIRGRYEIGSGDDSQRCSTLGCPVAHQRVRDVGVGFAHGQGAYVSRVAGRIAQGLWRSAGGIAWAIAELSRGTRLRASSLAA